MKTIYTSEYKSLMGKLKKARVEAGFTQQEVAKKLKKPQSYVSKSESGERRLDFVEISNFLKIYGKDISYLNKK